MNNAALLGSDGDAPGLLFRSVLPFKSPCEARRGFSSEVLKRKAPGRKHIKWQGQAEAARKIADVLQAVRTMKSGTNPRKQARARNG